MGIGNHGSLPGPGPGRPKGRQNKATRQLKSMILEALENVGGVAYFERVAEERPELFLPLVSKILPSEMKQSEAPARIG